MDIRRRYWPSDARDGHKGCLILLKFRINVLFPRVFLVKYYVLISHIFAKNQNPKKDFGSTPHEN